MGGGGSTQSSNIDIPSWVEGGLWRSGTEADQVIEQMEDLRHDPGQIVAPFDPAQARAFESMESQIGDENQNIDLARTTLADLAGGGMMNAPIDVNPYLNQAFDAAAEPSARMYRETIAPTIAGNASMSGRFGSAAHERAVAGAERELADSLTGLSGQMSYDMYGNERARQLEEATLRGQSAGAIPTMEAQRFADMDRLSQIGAQRQAYDQAQREAALTVPYATLAPAMGILMPSMSTATPTTTSSVSTADNIMGYGLGAAQVGLGSMAMMSGNPMGAALVAGGAGTMAGQASGRGFGSGGGGAPSGGGGIYGGGYSLSGYGGLY